MDYKRLIEIFHAYIDHDYRSWCDTDHIRKALEQVASHKEIVELGFGWLYPEEC